ncbi:protein FAR-RED ELONGATED HYPOCOTYL 3-like [Neltuma alba]|uniref:protein FAR-RED ELONGATED HYPOCOTYL 3-like n=1 Tax=Neltuma alba TaxID=207710 RepID=UPI0010A2A9EB|nr:protein FAR-RED ELONGATED HYPOCOTYL 3-like [Prosopis alba]
MYLCFNAAKVGWKVGCRPLIGVDGTFLKGKARGILLTAVGLNANDLLYPLAFALVDKENGVNWTWFIQWLRISLDLHNGGKVTFMSDMQKGLQHAVIEILPEAEHRLCARHIYANWSKRWRGNEMKKKIFSCAWSTFEEQFKDNLKALGALNKEAAEAMVSYPISTWVRASFSNRCLSWVVDNNMSESLNAWIDEYRYLLVIRMFDGIRVKMMEKWAESEQNVRNWKGNYSPKCLDLFEANRLLSFTCRVFFNGDEGFEVTEGQDRHTVCLTRKTCTCRAWDLTGILCQHAIHAMYHCKLEPLTHISRYYHKDTYIASYRTKFAPVRGKRFWDTE